MNQGEGLLDGRVAIVTGGASGIGLATSLLFAEHGATVAIFGRDAEAGRAAVAGVRERGADARFVPVDLADPAVIAPAVQGVVDELGSVHVLVNNAATRGAEQEAGRAGLFDIDVGNWDTVHAINVRAPFLLTQAVGRHLVERGEGGHIVNVTSSAAFMASRCSMHYASSKAALTSLTRTAASDLGMHGINVNAVAPGPTRTPYRAERLGGGATFEQLAAEGPMANLLHQVAESEDVAAVILFLCTPASRQITGQTIHTSAGFIV